MQGTFDPLGWLVEKSVKDTAQRDVGMMMESKDVPLVTFIYYTTSLNALVAELSFVKKEKGNYLKNKKRLVLYVEPGFPIIRISKI